MTIPVDLPDELMSFLATYGPTPERGALQYGTADLEHDRRAGDSIPESQEDRSC